MALPVTISQRGVGCTQVVKLPLGSGICLRPDLLDRLAAEIDVGLERAEHAPVLRAALAERCGSGRGVERADARLGVEDHALRGDASGWRHEQDVAARHRIRRCAGSNELVGEDLLACVAPVALAFDFAHEPDAVGVDPLQRELLESQPGMVCASAGGGTKQDGENRSAACADGMFHHARKNGGIAKDITRDGAARQEAIAQRPDEEDRSGDDDARLRAPARASGGLGRLAATPPARRNHRGDAIRQREPPPSREENRLAVATTCDRRRRVRARCRRRPCPS